MRPSGCSAAIRSIGKPPSQDAQNTGSIKAWQARVKISTRPVCRPLPHGEKAVHRGRGVFTKARRGKDRARERGREGEDARRSQYTHTRRPGLRRASLRRACLRRASRHRPSSRATPRDRVWRRPMTHRAAHAHPIGAEIGPDMARRWSIFRNEEFFLSVTERNLSVGEHNLSVTEHNLSVEERKLSEAHRKLSVAGRNLSVTEFDVSAMECRLSATEHNGSVGECSLLGGGWRSATCQWTRTAEKRSRAASFFLRDLRDFALNSGGKIDAVPSPPDDSGLEREGEDQGAKVAKEKRGTNLAQRLTAWASPLRCIPDARSSAHRSSASNRPPGNPWAYRCPDWEGPRRG